MVKGGWLNVADLFAVSLAYPDLQDMIELVPDLLQLDFSSLRDSVLDYATQTLIEPSRVQLMTACAVHYNLNIGLVVRYLGGEYTASWRSVTDILNAAAPYVTEEVFSHLQRVLTLGCPAEFDWHEPVENKNRFILRENLPNVNQYAEVAQKTVTKEVRNSHLIPFASWVCVASAHARHTPQNVLIKPNKKPRLIWDGSSKEFWYETTIYDEHDDSHGERVRGFVWQYFPQAVCLDLEFENHLPKRGHPTGFCGYLFLLPLPTYSS